MSNPTAYLGAATIFALRAAAGSQGMPTTRGELALILGRRYGKDFDGETISRVIRQLAAWSLVDIINDKYAGEILRLYKAKSDSAVKVLISRGHDELVSKFNSGGFELFTRVLANPEFWGDLDEDPLPELESELSVGDEPSVVADIPASDRIVSRSDNRADVELIEADVRGLVEEISSSNEAGNLLGDEKDIVTGELKAAEVLVSQAAFRVSRLAGLVFPVLRFLAEKFATGAIGEMAKRLITAILSLS